jgi:hypothetical protein
VSNSSGTVTSSAATLTVNPAGTLPTALLANLSVRTTLASGKQLIPGFVTVGTKSLLLRLSGPNLNQYGLSGMADPILQIYNNSSVLTAQNDNWDSSLATTFSQLGATPFAVNSKDSALIAAITGPNSAFAFGASGSGTVLMELYDTQTNDYSNRLINVSARTQVGTGADALFVGFVIVGSGSKQLLIRGIGPKLGTYGVVGFLADPYLQLYNASGTQIASNDNWDSSLASTFTQVGAFSLDAGSNDAALLVTLPPGVYSVKLTGVNNGTGEGLVEVYEIWP